MSTAEGPSRLPGWARPRLLVVVALLAAVGGAVVGAHRAVAGPHVSRARFDTPVYAALSWFAAIDAGDARATRAHFAAPASLMWTGDPSDWAGFSDVRCRRIAPQEAAATVYCSFSESDAPDVGNPDSWWTVDFAHEANGRWLITNYGQG